MHARTAGRLAAGLIGIGTATAAYASLVERCSRLIAAGRRDGKIPEGPPARVTALAFVGAMEGITIALAGQRAYDERYAAQVAAGVLGLDPLEER
jgi:hypothetical protein